MKRAGLFVLAFVAIALTFSGSALGQVPPGDNSYYFVTYFSNNVPGAPDATLRIINDGSGTFDDSTGLTLGAFISVFDDSQELQECGECPITPDGLLSEDVKTELTNNTLTGKVLTRGVIKVVSAAEVFPVAGLRGWATHIQRASPTSGSYVTTEAPLTDSNLTSGELQELINLCEFALQLGSGQGSITCTPEDHDF